MIVMTYMGVSINGGTPKMGDLQKENPFKMDDLGVPLFQETPIYIYIYLCIHCFFFPNAHFFSHLPGK